MGISAIGIYPYQSKMQDVDGKAVPMGTTKRIYSTDSTDYTSTMAVRFRTASDISYSFNVWVTVWGINRNGNEAVNGYRYIGATGDIGLAASAFTKSGSDSAGYTWAINFSNITGLNALLGPIKYSTRRFDAIQLKIEVRTRWGSGADDSTASASTCWIGFIPSYQVSGDAYWDTDGLHIGYSATNWGRPHDRFQLKGALTGTLSGTSTKVTYIQAGAQPWGVTDKYGSLTIPAKSFLRVPQSGDRITGLIRMVGSWQMQGLTLAELTIANKAVVNKTAVTITPEPTPLDPTPSAIPAGTVSLKSPTISAVLDGDAVTVTVGQTGSGTDLDYVEVSMVGSRFSCDRATLSVGDSYTFYAPPLGMATQWQAVGYATYQDQDYFTEAAVADVPAIPQRYSYGVTLTPINGAGSVRLPYSFTANSQSRPEAETVKLAGRDRQTVGFGEGGSVTWTFTGKIVLPQFSQMYGGADMEVSDEEAIRNLPMQGAVVMRLSDGTRALLEVTNAGVSQPIYGDNRRTVSISAQEVS